jgi:SM-20-related protein
MMREDFIFPSKPHRPAIVLPTNDPSRPMIDLLEINPFLDADTLAQVRAEVERAGGSAATVLGERAGGGELRSAVRRATRVAVPDAVRERVKAALMAKKPELEAHFGVELAGCEDPQFLRYEEGDFFVAHQDGNTPMLYDDSRFRRISCVAFLNPRTDAPQDGAYGGGELVFHGPWNQPNVRVAASAAPGSLVTFRAETTHEVTPVTHGVRYTIATWFRAPEA